MKNLGVELGTIISDSIAASDAHSVNAYIAGTALFLTGCHWAAVPRTEKDARKEAALHFIGSGIGKSIWQTYAKSMVSLAAKLAKKMPDHPHMVAARRSETALEMCQNLGELFAEQGIAKPYHVALWAKKEEATPLTADDKPAKRAGKPEPVSLFDLRPAQQPEGQPEGQPEPEGQPLPLAPDIFAMVAAIEDRDVLARLALLVNAKLLRASQDAANDAAPAKPAKPARKARKAA